MMQALLAALVLAMAAPALGQDMEVMKRRMIESQKEAMDGHPKHEAEVKREQLPLLRVEDGWLHLEPAELTFNATTRVKVKGDDSDWMLMTRSPKDARGSYTIVQRIDFSEADGGGNWMVSANSSPGRLSLSGIGGLKADYYAVSLNFSALNAREERSVKLNVSQLGGPKPLLAIKSPDLNAMRQEHPEAVQQYLVPLLVAINGDNPLNPAAVEIYRVFDQIPASPTAITQVKQLLAQLGSPLPDQRTAGSQALREMGRDGVLAVLRMDLSRIGPEERSRIDEFLAFNTTRRNPDVNELRRDPHFLIDCLGDADAAVRSAAQAALAEAMQAPVDFEVHAPAAERKAQIAMLRKELLAKAKAKKSEGEAKENSE